MSYKFNNLATILNFVRMKCPLCDEYFRNKTNLRIHLKRKHSEIEAEDYIKKH